jgi:hypothetical protein
MFRTWEGIIEFQGLEIKVLRYPLDGSDEDIVNDDGMDKDAMYTEPELLSISKVVHIEDENSLLAATAYVLAPAGTDDENAFEAFYDAITQDGVIAIMCREEEEGPNGPFTCIRSANKNLILQVDAFYAEGGAILHRDAKFYAIAAMRHNIRHVLNVSSNRA